MSPLSSRMVIQKLEMTRTDLQNKIAKEVQLLVLIFKDILVKFLSQYSTWMVHMYLVMYRKKEMQFCMQAWKDESKPCVIDVWLLNKMYILLSWFSFIMYRWIFSWALPYKIFRCLCFLSYLQVNVPKLHKQ